MMRLFILSLFTLISSLALSQGIHSVIDYSKKSNSIKDLPPNYITDMMIADRAKKNGTQTECDVLTANRYDPGRAAYPVEFKDINGKKAVAACMKAVEKDPLNPRLWLNYGRAFNKIGDYKSSFLWTKKAKEKGYSYAYHALALHYSYGEGVKKDPKQEQRYYELAAEYGVKWSNIRLANIELNKAIENIDFEKAKKYILDAGHFQGDSSLVWGKFHHAKSKFYLRHFYKFDWKEILKNKDVKKIKLRLKQSQVTEYANMISSAITHYKDFLKDKTQNKSSHQKIKNELKTLQYFKEKL